MWLFVFFNVTLQRNTADMAQLVEQRIRNAQVPGSSPGIGSICGISTSVVHGLPKPGRRVRFPYSAHRLLDIKIRTTFLSCPYLLL